VSEIPATTSLGLVFWFTGLSGAGKSTLSDLLRDRLRQESRNPIQVDGDALRGGLCKDLGFTQQDRDENIRRAAELAKLLANQGFIVLCTFISPLKQNRDLARTIVGESFVEVFVDCRVQETIRRDPKGLYARALRGEIPNFTGISAPYEEPETPDLHLRTDEIGIVECVEVLLTAIPSRGSK
jgi:bifunctional enzyme CysN/CysC